MLKKSLEDKIKNFANLAYSNIEAEVKKQADLAAMFKLNRYQDLLAIDKQDRENARPYTGECVCSIFWLILKKLCWCGNTAARKA